MALHERLDAIESEQSAPSAEDEQMSTRAARCPRWMPMVRTQHRSGVSTVPGVQDGGRRVSRCMALDDVEPKRRFQRGRRYGVSRQSQ